MSTAGSMNECLMEECFLGILAGTEAASRLEIAAPSVEAGRDLASARRVSTVDTSNNSAPCLCASSCLQCPPPSEPRGATGAGTAGDPRLRSGRALAGAELGPDSAPVPVRWPSVLVGTAWKRAHLVQSQSLGDGATASFALVQPTRASGRPRTLRPSPPPSSVVSRVRSTGSDVGHLFRGEAGGPRGTRGTSWWQDHVCTHCPAGSHTPHLALAGCSRPSPPVRAPTACQRTPGPGPVLVSPGLLCAQAGTRPGGGQGPLSTLTLLFLPLPPSPRSAVISCHTPAFSVGRVRNRTCLPQWHLLLTPRSLGRVSESGEGGASGRSLGTLGGWSAPTPSLRPQPPQPPSPPAQPPWGCVCGSSESPLPPRKVKMLRPHPLPRGRVGRGVSVLSFASWSHCVWSQAPGPGVYVGGKT